jgi:hypothetical protein
MSMPIATPEHLRAPHVSASAVRASWLSPQLLPAIHPQHGRGFVATADIGAGTPLLEVIDCDSDREMDGTTTDRDERIFSVADTAENSDWSGQNRVDRIERWEAGAFNARFSDSRKVVATRAIQRGELIRIEPRRAPEFAKALPKQGNTVVSSGIGILLRFLMNALRYEWSAAVVSFASAIPSNVLSCFIVIWSASWLREHQIVESEAAYISVVSILTGFVGYATYLVGYYGGMLIKERADLFDNGVFSWRNFRKKCRVIWYDFVIHLPSDFYSLPLLSVGQGGMYVAGVSQFWSIFWAQAIADAFSAVKEPFFWHGAKKLAEFTEHNVSNQDQIGDRSDRVVNE